MRGGGRPVAPYAEVEGGLGTCLATGDAGGADAGRDGEGGVHVFVIADRRGLRVGGVGVVGGVGGGGGVGVGVGRGEHLVCG